MSNPQVPAPKPSRKTILPEPRKLHTASERAVEDHDPFNDRPTEDGGDNNWPEIDEGVEE